MEIKLTKLKEVDDPTHPHNIPEGYEKIIRVSKEDFNNPEVGKMWYIGYGFRTSIIRELINNNTVKTLNSIYKWEVISED